jgi:hypothetical protein
MPGDSGARRDQPVRRARKTAQAPQKPFGKPSKTPGEKALDRLDQNPNDLEAWDQVILTMVEMKT